jgi:hypothetical protein
MTTRVRVLQVETPELDRGRLLACGIDRPAPGDESTTHSLPIRGWVLGRSAPVETVEIVHDGAVLRAAAVVGKRRDIPTVYAQVEGAEACEFFANVSLIGLPATFEILLQAVVGDEARVPIGVIRGSRSPFTSGFEPRLKPLMLTTVGRSGSTIVISALGAHPQIVAYPAFEREARVASYWMDVFATLSQPASYVRQIAPGGPRHGRWWAGEREPTPRVMGNDHVERWLASAGVEALARFCQTRIESLYEELAASRGKSGAVYFAEKFSADAVAPLVWELYPDAREVVLVRDFRDTACSVMAKTAKFRGVEQARDPRQVLRDVQSRMAGIARVWEQRSQYAHLVRYEDLIHHPTETLDGVLGYLGVESSPETIAGMVEALAPHGESAERHRTTSEAEASIGRWRHDLDTALQREYELALRRGLELFGYPLEVA